MSRSLVMWLLLGGGLVAGEAALERIIPNPLRQSWPHELVSMDFPPEQHGVYQVVHGMGEPRPVQWERTERDGAAVARAWFIATVLGEQRADAGKREKAPEELTVRFAPGSAQPGISLTRDATWYTISNGVYDFRVRCFDGLEQPVAFAELPHWYGGSRVAGTTTWDGIAWSQGDALVADVHTRVLAQGPVYVDLHITYTFADASEQGTVAALPLAASKRTHFDVAGVQRREHVPARTRHYEVVLRFVAGDPWAEVVERYRLPAPRGEDPHHGYRIAYGRLERDAVPAGVVPADDDGPVAIDTVMWTRWFEYDRFGGNDRQHILPAEPRSVQRGRPFARLRPRWHQGGAGAQEVFLTAGGESGEDRRVPCYGIVAAYPSKWVGPYRAEVVVRMDGPWRGFAFPLRDGGGRADGPLGQRWYGQRCYAIVTGERRRFDSTGKADALIRRHSDWTLTALINSYILEWDRDPAARGPHILMSRERLEQLRADHAAGRDTPAMRAIAHWQERADAAERELVQAREELAALDKGAPGYKAARKRVKQLERETGGLDAKLVALIRGERVKPPGGPSASRYFKRYQDDSTNPTNYGNRRMVNRRFPPADLFTVDEPFGGAGTAAIGYIYSDLDAWPGWENGWSPGNPNFHTDKYIAAVFAGASMPDHPHAADWLAFGRRNFAGDLDRVLLAPDGVGWECPGYAGYALRLQLENARVLRNAGYGNFIADDPRVAGTARWHRKLITPYDRRIARRHEAPHGDTHRWDAGLNEGFAELAVFYRESDPAFASELMSAYTLLRDSGVEMELEHSLLEHLTRADLSIPATPPEQLDWASEAFFGFGAVLRNGFGSDQETFLSLRAGRCMGHYHNDALAFHYYSDGAPVALDYNCSYHPRGDHAALHNSMTFGETATVRNNATGEPVEAMEQLYGPGRVGAFADGELGDAVVAERDGRYLVLSPVDPRDAEFARRYPSRAVEPVVHRRLLALVEHPTDSPLRDYLVVRDETRCAEAQQLNVHLLARSAERDGTTWRLRGQYDTDMLLHVAHASGLEAQQRWWHYGGSHHRSPGEEFVQRPGESQEQWAQRMAALRAERGWQTIPGPDWEPEHGSEAEQARWREAIAASDGKALLPPPGWHAIWPYGEIQLWLRLHTDPGTPVLWVLYPHARGGPVPRITTLDDGAGVRIELDGHVETVRLGSDAKETVVIERGAQREVLVGGVPPLGAIEDRPLP